MILDLAYGEITLGMSEEERAEIDAKLAEFDEEDEEEELISITRETDGEVIQITRARLNQIRRNMAAPVRLPRPGQEV